MSDLQCASSVLVLGPVPPADVLAALPARRVALVYASGEAGTSATAAELARTLDVAVRAAADDEAATGGPPLVDDVLEDLADEHRGECVVLVVGQEALEALVRRSDDTAAAGVLVEIDDDGRRVSAVPTAR